MGFFSSKPKADMELFCSAYYDFHIFHAIVDAEDRSQKILDIAYQQLTDSEPSFSKVDHLLFEREMAAMHLELFALAFSNRFPKIAVQHSIFTLQYLQNKGRSDIWEAMREYNKVIAQTATMDASGQQMSEDTAVGRMTIVGTNDFRWSLFKDWIKSYIGDTAPDNLTEKEKEIVACISRVCSRVLADITRNKQIGNRSIAGLFLQRLGAENILGKNWQANEDFMLRIASQPLSMYEYAIRGLKTVDLTFS